MDGYNYEIEFPISRVHHESLPMGTIQVNPQLSNEAVQRVNQFVHDANRGVLPDPAVRARSLAGCPVIQIFIPSGCYKRMAALSVVLAHAQISDQLSQGGPHLEMASYFLVQHGNSYLVLLEKATQRFVDKLCHLLTKPNNPLFGNSHPFLVSPSAHRKLISFDTWRQLHMGETCGPIFLDSHEVFDMFLASPMMGACPVPLYNYFAGLRIAHRLF